MEFDQWVVRLVVITLGITVLVAIIGAIVLTGMGQISPDILTIIGSTAASALAGVLIAYVENK